jgi:hypothetical protein
MLHCKCQKEYLVCLLIIPASGDGIKHRYEKKTKLEAIKEIFQDYGQDSTIQGLNYIFYSYQVLSKILLVLNIVSALIFFIICSI